MSAENQAEFEILGETRDFVAVNKPAGLLVHPTKPGGPRTLWDGLRDLLGYEIATGGQVSLINRLDRETSGVVLVAKSAAGAREAGRALQRGEFHKEYLALVFGWPEWESRVEEAPILRLGEVATSSVWLQRAVHPAGQSAVTRFQVERRATWKDRPFSLVRAWPVTGRTHQIRVHLAHAGHPVIGDKIYGGDPQRYLDFIREGWTPQLEQTLWMSRHALHAARLEWAGAGLSWTAPLPGDFRDFLGHAAG